jgi:hypothetical protein
MGAFQLCSSLASITIPFVGSKLNPGTSDPNYFGYIFGASNYSLNYSFVPSSLRNVTITGPASGMTTIPDYAFYECSKLTTITYKTFLQLRQERLRVALD